MPIFAATITTIIVFVPTVFLEGQIKLLFIPLTFTISISLFASFLVSRTVTPLLALKLITPERPIDPASRSARDRLFRLSQRFFTWIEERYQRVIEWALFTNNTGPHSASVQVYLSTADQRQRSDGEIMSALRPRFAGKFPGTTYRFVPGGLVARTINFGSETALEVEVLGYDLGAAAA